MHSAHARNTVRYYIILIVLLAFLFFSGDFGLIDVQKTAIVMATGIDKQGEEFVVTSQIAVPKGSQQEASSEAVQLVSKGKTVAEAFEEINAKTGWYPKLVFCRLIVFGEKAAEENVFDALDFFLRDEYLTDDCQLAVCEGTAQELLNVSALIDPSSSAAISKVLSSHAERVGTVHPTNLKDFAIGYFGDSQSGALPILKAEAQQETPPAEGGNEGGNQEGGQEGNAPSDSEGSGQNGASESTSSGEEKGGSNGAQTSQSGSKGGGQGQDKPVFSAKETALFVRGRWVERLTAEETFALNAVTSKLRLASFSAQTGEETCTLSVKYSSPKIKLNVGKNGMGELKIDLSLVAGVLDYSKAQGVEQIKDMGNPPDGAFSAAEKRLAADISSAYEKAQNVGCDVMGIAERLVKYKKRRLLEHKDVILQNTTLTVKVNIKGVR